MVEVSIEAKDVIERKTDDRGRVRLGPEFADKTVEVAVVEVVEDEDSVAGQATN